MENLNLNFEKYRTENENLKRFFRETNPKNSKMVGLKNSIKTINSIQTKIERGFLLSEINDILRYTILLDENNYRTDVLTVENAMLNRGLKLIEKRDWWKTEKLTGYQGINENWKIENIIFEVQFHTQKSYGIKSENHTAYENFRIGLDMESNLSKMVKNWHGYNL